VVTHSTGTLLCGRKMRYRWMVEIGRDVEEKEDSSVRLTLRLSGGWARLKWACLA
jgi:hypothetical protein